MARGKAVELGTRSFPTQGEATSYFKAMLGRYQPGDRVSETDGLGGALLDRLSAARSDVKGWSGSRYLRSFPPGQA